MLRMFKSHWFLNIINDSIWITSIAVFATLWIRNKNDFTSLCFTMADACSPHYVHNKRHMHGIQWCSLWGNYSATHWSRAYKLCNKTQFIRFIPRDVLCYIVVGAWSVLHMFTCTFTRIRQGYYILVTCSPRFISTLHFAALPWKLNYA